MINLDEFNAFELIHNGKIVATYFDRDTATKAMWKLNDDLRDKYGRNYAPCVYVNYIKEEI